MGRYQDAEGFYQEALDIRRLLWAQTHAAEIAESCNSLGGLYVLTTDYLKAEHLFRKALRIQEPTCGPEHPIVADTFRRLGHLYAVLARYDDAITLLRPR